MNKKVIIVAGYLASGKSTFALRMAREIGVPYLIKDTLKIALCDSVSVTDKGESSRFSAVTFDVMMYVTERMLEAGCPIIIEGNFVPAGVKRVDESLRIRQLIRKFDCASLTFKFHGDTKVLLRRFVEREKSPERGLVNTMGYEPSLDEFDAWCHNLDAFDVGGELVEIDTTDFAAVDFNRYIELAKHFVNETEQ